MFWDGFDDLPQNKREKRLNEVLLEAFNMTISALSEKGASIAPATLAARESLLQDISKYI